MTVRICIREKTDTPEDMVNLLRHIANLIEDGKRGYHTGWELQEEEQLVHPCESCGLVEGTIACGDGILRCVNCSAKSGYDLNTGEKVEDGT